MLIGGQRLIPEEDHQVVEQGVVNFSKNAGAQWN